MATALLQYGRAVFYCIKHIQIIVRGRYSAWRAKGKGRITMRDYTVQADILWGVMGGPFVLTQNDALGTLRFFLTEAGKPVNLTGLTAQVSWKKPTGAVNTSAISQDGDFFVFTPGAARLTQAGLCEGRLRIYQGENRLTAARFYVTVEADMV